MYPDLPAQTNQDNAAAGRNAGVSLRVEMFINSIEKKERYRSRKGVWFDVENS
jgi:hypothetical protein